MSVEDTTIINFVSIDNMGNVVLTVSDHIGWSDEQKHMSLLQEKINTYCVYVENGQIYDEYPEARDKRALISVVLFHDPSVNAKTFFIKVKSILEAEGFGFDWKNYIR